MRSILTIVLLCFLGLNMKAQTSKELIGKWQLVKWVKNGEEQDIKSKFKTDQVFQVFKVDGAFESVNGDKTHKGKWKLSDANDELTITTMLLPVKFSIDHFDAQKRVITNSAYGTFEYKKVAD